MKYVATFVIALSMLGSLAIIRAMSLPTQSQSASDMEKKIEKIFLLPYDEREGVKHDKKAELEKLGSEEEVKAVLLEMVGKHKYAQPETLEFIYLKGATWMLGEMSVKQAQGSLSQMLFNRRVDEDVRALAARSLGQIDVEANKQILLRALADVSDYYLIRVYAAEGLAKTKDPEVLKALERYSREEKDSHVREKFQKAAQEVRSKIPGSR